MILAITGGTGFVGGRLIDLAIAAGHHVRALTRRPQPARDGMIWVPGSLADDDALAALVTGVDAVIHVAGLTSAPDLAAFREGNVAGTRSIIVAANAAQVPRFVHTSSLSAREPALSMYGASKQEAEQVVAESGLAWAMVRPPAIYGPGELLDVFKMAKLGFVLLPPSGRLSIVGVDDLCRLLLALASADAPSGVIYDVDDGRPGGWDQPTLARAFGTAVGRRVLPIQTPRGIMQGLSLIDRAVRGKKAVLTVDRVSYFCHPDWTADPDRLPPPDLWQPNTPTPEGLAATAAWYRAQGLL